jgi:hypothetical protein
MSAPQSIDIIKLVNALKRMRSCIDVPTDFHNQVHAIDRLLRNDKTGLVTTTLDYMENSANVDMKIETQNKNLDGALYSWQNVLLNKDVAKDIPRGLRALSTEYYRERWRSSFIVLRMIWEDVKVGRTSYKMPTQMWFLNGASVHSPKEQVADLRKRVYTVQVGTEYQPLVTDVIIRKPYSSWYELYPTPFLVRRGVLFNAMLKEAVVTKQADVIESIVPYMLLLKSGTDALAKAGKLPKEHELKALKQSIVEATQEHDSTGELGKLIASLSYDVDMEHFMPDLNKVFNDGILKSVDRNIVAGLGLIELEGFSNTRQEAILNPQFLVQEVKDAVVDWSLILEEIVYQILETNAKQHPKLVNNKINVIPATIKAFITEEMKQVIRSLYDRGLISKQSATENITDFDFEVEVTRRETEEKRDLAETMKPPLIQNLEQNNDPNVKEEDTLEDRKTNTPEADNFNMAIVAGIKQVKENNRKKEEHLDKKIKLINKLLLENED